MGLFSYIRVSFKLVAYICVHMCMFVGLFCESFVVYFVGLFSHIHVSFMKRIAF